MQGTWPCVLILLLAIHQSADARPTLRDTYASFPAIIAGGAFSARLSCRIVALANFLVAKTPTKLKQLLRIVHVVGPLKVPLILSTLNHCRRNGIIQTCKDTDVGTILYIHDERNVLVWVVHFEREVGVRLLSCCKYVLRSVLKGTAYPRPGLVHLNNLVCDSRGRCIALAAVVTAPETAF
jgi:hypothetical protein